MRIAIVTPVLDDWESLTRLIADLAVCEAARAAMFQLVVVNDASTLAWDTTNLPIAEAGSIHRIDLITLGTNLGHQRAIAVGLVHVAEADEVDAVVVMDSDGEDRTSDISRLVEAFKRHSGAVVLAARVKRHESARFRIGYAAYKALFRVLVGREISFGNFSLLPIAAVRRLVYMPELWNNLPAAVLRSRLPSTKIDTERGYRYAGQSKMNLVSLIVHGLSAISVYLDTIFVRVLLCSVVFAAIVIICIIAAILIRTTTDLAIPGWTTSAIGALMTMLVQSIVLIVATTLMSLAGRSSRAIIPRADSHNFVSATMRVWPRDKLQNGKAIAA
jgi:glycosyltransferase involved in cell wall biosynthesis